MGFMLCLLVMFLGNSDSILFVDFMIFQYDLIKDLRYNRGNQEEINLRFVSISVLPQALSARDSCWVLTTCNITLVVTEVSSLTFRCPQSSHLAPRCMVLFYSICLRFSCGFLSSSYWELRSLLNTRSFSQSPDTAQTWVLPP